MEELVEGFVGDSREVERLGGTSKESAKKLKKKEENTIDLIFLWRKREITALRVKRNFSLCRTS